MFAFQTEKDLRLAQTVLHHNINKRTRLQAWALSDLYLWSLSYCQGKNLFLFISAKTSCGSLILDHLSHELRVLLLQEVIDNQVTPHPILRAVQ